MPTGFYKYFLTFCLASGLFVGSASTYAQIVSQPSMSIQTDSIFFAENESIVALTLAITNNSPISFNGSINLNSPDGITLLGKENIKLAVEGNSKSYYPIRLSVNKEIPAGESDFQLQLIDSSANITARFNSKLIIASKRQVQLFSHRPNELMRQVGDSLSVSVRLQNKGNNRESITLTASFPDLRGGVDLQHKQIKLKPFQDSIIAFSRIITKDLLRVERYSVNIAALYNNGDLINNVIVTVQNVSGNRSYVDPGQSVYNSYSANKISISGSNLFSESESILLNGRGIFQLPAGSLDFSINTYNYTHDNSRPLLTNTYLNYELNNKGVTIGSISESMETFVNGRGAKIYVQNEEKTNRLDLAFVDKSYNLLGDQYSATGETGYTAYAKTILSDSTGNTYMGNLLYDRSPNENSESFILMNQYQFKVKDSFQLGFEIGGGMTRPYYELGSSYKPSVALGNTLNGSLGKYSISSNTFYSSAYYPGIRRGVLQLNQRIGRSFNKLNTWLAYSFYDYDPEFMTHRYLVNSYFSNSRIDGGMSLPLAKRTSLSISMSRHTEKGNSGSQMNIGSPYLEMQSYRLTETLGWRSSNNQHIVYLSSENGFLRSPVTGETEFLIRANGSWNYKYLSLNTFYQQGKFSLTEAFMSSFQGHDNAYRFSLSPSVTKDFFNNKLKVQFNANFNYDSYSGQNWMYAGNVDYKISKNVSTFINSYLHTYKNEFNNSTFTTLQAGLSYSLPDGRNVSSEKKGTIELFAFYDNNTNGVFDEGDQPAEGRIISIAEISFITKKDGKVLYRKVPYGEYHLKIPSQNWYAIAPNAIVLDRRDLLIQIPLQPTGKITGAFYYKYDTRTSMDVVENYGGLRVLLEGDNGYKSQGLTNANGEFILFVPVGNYQFSVDETSLPKNVTTNFKPMQVTVEEGKPLIIPKVELNAKQRIIEVKRFSSE